MLPIMQLLRTYKWSIALGLGVFILCLLFINLGFWLTLLVIILTGIALVIGYIVDTKTDVTQLFKN